MWDSTYRAVAVCLRVSVSAGKQFSWVFILDSENVFVKIFFLAL